MALRILTKFKFINIIQHSRTLSSVTVVRQNVKLPGYCGIKQLLDVQVKISGIRFKYDHKKGKKASDDDDYDNDSVQDEFADDVDKKQIAKVRVQSLRCDLLLKSALGIGRSKIEAAFYEGNIRLNGRKINKKSVHCDSGDVIEMIRGVSATNPDHLSVARIEVIDVKTDGEEFIFVTMKRFKNLTVDKNDMKI